MKAAAQKTCRRCGATFACGAALQSCWCQALPPLPAERIEANADCYCPRCLAGLTAPAPEAAADVV